MNDRKELAGDMVNPKSWKEFQDAGLIWWVNRILHLFGWALVVVVQDSGEITDCYPARVGFRGFGPISEEAGFIKLSQYISEQAPIMLWEAEEGKLKDP